MIDNARTGQNIAARRQRLGWTQGELARRLNVTHQAVSKWENGIAFPDIATLLSLSRLFGVTMESLLTGEPAPEFPTCAPADADSAASNAAESAALPENAPASDDDPSGISAEAADIAPDEADPYDSDASEAAHTARPNAGYDWQQIIALAPFASRETLDRMVDSCGASCPTDCLFALAPFLSRQTLDRLIRSSVTDADWDTVISLAPFLSHDTLDWLIAQCASPCNREHIPALAPFLSHRTLDKMIRGCVTDANWDSVISLAPFLGHDTLDWLIAQCASPCSREHIPALAPFLSHRTLDKMIRGCVTDADWDSVIALAPFLGHDTLDWLIAQCASPCNREHIFALAPFLSHQTIDRLLMGSANDPVPDKHTAWAESHEEQMERAAAWAEAHEKQMEQAAAWAEVHEEQMERAAARAERIIERQNRRAAARSERKNASHSEKHPQQTAAEILRSFAPLLEQHIPAETLNQLIDGLEKTGQPDASLSPGSSEIPSPPQDARRTEIVKAESTASTLSEYADQTLDLLYQSCDATDPMIGRFEDIRRAIEGQDYAALNEFASFLDRHIGPQWLEEYAALCPDGEIPDDFDARISMAVTQRNWSWIEDHAHLITDPGIIRRIALVSSSEGFFDLIPLFIDRLDQHTIDYAARQAVRLGCTDDILPFAGRVSRGIID